MNSNNNITRRTILGAMGGLAVAGGSFLSVTGSAAGARIDNLTVSDASITTDDGTITDVKINVDGDWQFDGLDIPSGHRVDGVHIFLKAGNPGNEYILDGGRDYQETGNVHAASGNFSFADLSIFNDDNVNTMHLDQFADDSEGDGPKITTVGVEVEMVITLNGPANPQWSRAGWHGARDTTFDVNVTNQESESVIGAEGTSSVEGENQLVGGDGDPAQMRLVWSQGEEAFRVDNMNPANTNPIDYELRLYGSGDVVASGAIAGGHSGYEDPTGNYHALDVASNQTVELWAGGEKRDQTNSS
ncbi:MAG: hypothetical protein ABEI77_03890 [Halorientalis sp.]